MAKGKPTPTTLIIGPVVAAIATYSWLADYPMPWWLWMMLGLALAISIYGDVVFKKFGR